MNKIDTDKIKNSKITQGGTSIFKEFAAFISKGNVILLLL